MYERENVIFAFSYSSQFMFYSVLTVSIFHARQQEM